MNILIEKLTETDFPTIFKYDDLSKLDLEKGFLDNLLKESLASNEIIDISNNIFTLNKLYRKHLLSWQVISQKLVPDFYVSLEFVLSDVSWIPEAVYTVTCVTKGEPFFLDTKKYGRYRYINLPAKNLLAGVEEAEDDNGAYKVAKPLKALADIICRDEYNWTTLYPLHESFRIEDEDLETLTAKDFDELQGSCEVKNVEDFLCGIRKELKI